MNRIDFLKVLGLTGASLAVAGKIKIDDSITPEVQDKILLLREEILSLVKNIKPKVEITYGDNSVNTDEIHSHMETENGYVFSVKSLVYNMRYDIRYNIMNSNMDWWHQEWDINDFINKKDVIVLWNKKNNLYEFVCEILGIIEENKKFLSNYNWQEYQIDYIHLTIARCYMLIKDFENAEIWYSKCSINEKNQVLEDYSIFKIPMSDINFQSERLYKLSMTIKNKLDIEQVTNKMSEYKDLVSVTNKNSQITILN